MTDKITEQAIQMAVKLARRFRNQVRSMNACLEAERMFKAPSRAGRS